MCEPLNEGDADDGKEDHLGDGDADDGAERQLGELLGDLEAGEGGA